MPVSLNIDMFARITLCDFRHGRLVGFMFRLPFPRTFDLVRFRALGDGHSIEYTSAPRISELSLEQ